MLDRSSNPNRFLFAAVSLSALCGLLILVTVVSVMPTASRFDPSARPSASIEPSSAPAIGTNRNATLPSETFVDYTLVFPERPSHPVP